jgi:flagellar basal body-associated protein FliL
METVVIFVIATLGSAAVVWWTMSSTEGRTETREPRVSFRKAFQPTVPEQSPEGPATDEFVLLPTAGMPSVTDERPPRSVSLLRIVLMITFVAALGVAALAVIGLLVKLQLDQYFTR